jgi:hypothetical protein
MAVYSLQQEHTVWQSRWDGLASLIDTLRLRQMSGMPRTSLIQALLEQLRAFGASQFCYFYSGLAENATQRLQQPSEIPPDSPLYQQNYVAYPVNDHLLNALINQVASDIDVIWRQREMFLTAAGDQPGDQHGDIKLALQTGDVLASTTLDAWKPLLDNTTTAYTYLKTNADIRLLPYAPVAMVGVPATVLKTKRDYLVLFHELGHFLYWNAQRQTAPSPVKVYDDLNADLKSIGVGDQSPYRGWLEEIVADVIACLVAGPVMALRLQDLMLLAVGDYFTRDDGDYPPPSLRPYIALYTLEAMGSNVATDVRDTLMKRWEAVRSVRTVGKFWSPAIPIPPAHQRLRRPPITALKEESDEEARIFLRQVVPRIVNHFKPVVDRVASFWPALHGIKLTAQQPLDDLYRAFEKQMALEEAVASTRFDQRFYHEVIPLSEWQKKYEWSILAQSLVGVMPKCNPAEAAVIPYAIWIQLFRFAGWTSEGPGPGNAH